MNRGKLCSAARASLIVILFFLSLSEGRKIFEVVVDSQVDDIGPIEIKGEDDSGKPARPPALLDELDIQGGEISPVFDSNVFDYDVELSGAVADLRISAKFTLGTDHEKYKVKTKTKTVEQHLTDLESQAGGNETRTVVEIHVSADDHESVTYSLNIGKVSAGIDPLWTVFYQILFWTGVVIAVAVVLVFLYGLYTAFSGGILGSGSGRGEESSFNGGGQYENVGSSS